MNYRSEFEHDQMFISLINQLNQINRLDVFENAFGLSRAGNLIRVQRRMPFDVEVTFQNVSCVIETKVDADDNGRWNPPWQVQRMVEKAQTPAYLNPNKNFFLVTYGLHEFYGKPYDAGTGVPGVQHIPLRTLIDYVDQSTRLPLPNPHEILEWLRLMRIEDAIRQQATALLQAASIFRGNYLNIRGGIDFPNYLLTFNAPELAFPLFRQLADLWNGNARVRGPLMRLSIYPVPRQRRVFDSILNFWELWKNGPAIGNNILGDYGIDSKFYLEVNEDFNLNLKLDGPVPLPDVREPIRQQVHNALGACVWPMGVHGQPRDYVHEVWVLYEWDFGFLANLPNLQQIAQNLRDTAVIAIQHL